MRWRLNPPRRAGLAVAGLRAWLLLCAACTAGPSAAGGIYKWQDEAGKTHFSDKPPPDVTAERVRATGATGAEDRDAELEALRERAESGYDARKEKRAEAEEARAEAEKLAAHCRETRAKLEQLKSSTRHQVINAAGEREYMVEEQRQEWMQRARDEIARHCR